MSTLPYLQRQLKPRLVEFAQQTDLQGYALPLPPCFLCLYCVYVWSVANNTSYKTYNKSDLALALNDHLRAHQSRYSRNALFEEFYSRMTRPGRGSSERATTPSTASPRRSGRKVKTEDADSQYVYLS